MKSKIAIVPWILIVLLGVALIYRHNQAGKLKQADEASILQLSNDVMRTSAKLSEQQKVNVTLETNLVVQAVESQQYSNKVVNLSNQMASLSGTLAKVEADAKAAAQAAEADLAKRDAKIADLESERDNLTKRMADLNISITTLETQISETQRKLVTSEGDRQFLLKELKRLQAEKAELERQFNDMAVLREQVRKLKDELSISRRLDWIRKGLYGLNQKGGERLQAGINPPVGQTTNYDLNVEIKQDGAAKIVSPPNNNLPPANNPTPPSAPQPPK